MAEQKETTREYTRGEMREACRNNYNAGWNAAIDAIRAHWSARKGWAEYTWPRRGKAPFQWRWMPLSEMLRHRDAPMRLRAMRKRITRHG